MAKPQLLINSNDSSLPKSTRIRPELNLDRWCLWSPSSSRIVKPRRLEQEIRLNSGITVKGVLEIPAVTRHLRPSEIKELKRLVKLRNPNQKTEEEEQKKTKEVTETLTTFDQRVYYALIKIWEEKGESITYTYLSLRGLARELQLSWGEKTIIKLSNSLYRLRKVTLSWNTAFINAEKNSEVETQEFINILAKFKMVTRKENGHITKEQGYFQFDEKIAQNLRANHRRPVLFDVVLSFKSEVAQILYTQLDRIFSEINHYERRSKELFSDLGLDGNAYQHAANRKQLLERAIAELRGKALSKGGIIAKAQLVSTTDKRDYKVVFAKGFNIKKPTTQKNDNVPSSENELTKRLSEELGISLSVARYFQASYRSRALDWCEAKKHSRELSDKGAGFFYRAITEDWKLPTDYQEIKARVQRRATEEREQQITQAKDNHWQKNANNYLIFAETELERIRQENPEAFQKFEKYSSDERKKYEGFGLGDLHFQQARTSIADWFFNDGYWSHYEIPFTTFWEWDEKHNPKPFVSPVPNA